jgi:hypothetical protein
VKNNRLAAVGFLWAFPRPDPRIGFRDNRCSRSEICGDGVRSVSVEVQLAGPQPGTRRDALVFRSRRRASSNWGTNCEQLAGQRVIDSPAKRTNPTMATINRYAEAVGAVIHYEVHEQQLQGHSSRRSNVVFVWFESKESTYKPFGGAPHGQLG